MCGRKSRAPRRKLTHARGKRSIPYGRNKRTHKYAVLHSPGKPGYSTSMPTGRELYDPPTPHLQNAGLQACIATTAWLMIDDVRDDNDHDGDDEDDDHGL